MPVIHIREIKHQESPDSYEREKTRSLQKLHNQLKNGNDVFVLVYMQGCGPCEHTRPKWEMLNERYKNNNNICVADIDQALLQSVDNDLLKKDIVGFPTMRHIRGNTMQNYEDVEGIKKDRSLESLIEWLEKRSKSKQRKEKTIHYIRGGAKKRRTRKWSLKYKHSINCRRPRGFSQKQHCKSRRIRRM